MVPAPRQLGQYWNLCRSVLSGAVSMSQHSVWNMRLHVSRHTLSPWWKLSKQSARESPAPS
eukprot:3538847-Lingulodinium_polyedra.AAC.1